MNLKAEWNDLEKRLFVENFYDSSLKLSHQREWKICEIRSNQINYVMKTDGFKGFFTVREFKNKIKNYAISKITLIPKVILVALF